MKHYSFDAQREKLVEECEELIEAAQGEDYDNFIEELADVSIMILQMVMSLDKEQQEQYDIMIDLKLSRTIQRTCQKYQNTYSNQYIFRFHRCITSVCKFPYI